MDAGTAKDFIDDLQQQVNHLTAQVEFWRLTALRAMENTDKALAVIELHKALKTELEKAVSSD
jgi:uncharacterized protein with PhoU and TrkA domain